MHPIASTIPGLEQLSQHRSIIGVALSLQSNAAVLQALSPEAAVCGDRGADVIDMRGPCFAELFDIVDRPVSEILVNIHWLVFGHM